MWSAGISLFTTAPRWKRIKRVLFNPGIIAVELGLLRMLFEPDLPLVAVSAIHALGECTTPLAMIIVGMILAEIPLKNFLSGKALLLSAIRQLFMPLVLLLSLRGLHIDPLLTRSQPSLRECLSVYDAILLQIWGQCGSLRSIAVLSFMVQP